jgi:hypothetical protein
MKTKFTSLKKFGIALILLGLVSSSHSKAQTWTIYDGSVLPDAATPAWATGDLGTPQAVYSIVDDPDISGNKLLYDTTTADADKKSFKLNIAQPTNATWMIRTKAANNNPVSMEFELNAVDGTSAKFRINLKLYVHPTKGGYLRTNYLNTNITYPSDSSLTVQSFHTYRVTVENGSTFKVYLDENTTAIVEGTGITGSTQSQFLRFGDVGSAFTEGYVDWMAWDVTGAYAPGTILPSGVKVDGVATSVKSNLIKKVSVYPNPAFEQLNIKNAGSIAKYEIVNLEGKILRKAMNNTNDLRIDITGLKQGVYFLKTYSNEKIEQTKFIKK